MSGTKFYGIVAAQNKDNVGEEILLDGLEDQLRFARDEHDPLSAFRIIGDISFSKKIYSEKDCENEKELRCWNHAKVPLLYAEGTLFDNEDHPNAKAAAAILRYCQNHDSPLKPGFSVDGAIMERRDVGGNPTQDREKGKILAKTIAHSAAFTVNPCNPKCAGALYLDEPPALQKSITPPPAYVEALQKSMAMHSFNEIAPETMILQKFQQLKKSLENIMKGHGILKCHNCGKAERFFKSAGVPNSCHHCGTGYTMKQVWESLNK